MDKNMEKYHKMLSSLIKAIWFLIGKLRFVFLNTQALTVT